jgi:mannose-6-phosphate isomerase-like protein (cupin superfamily)
MLHPAPGDFVLIPRGIWHRLLSDCESAVRVLEVAYGAYDQENDIERKQDDYGRQLTGTGTGAG